MASFEAVKNGIETYLEKEVLNKIADWRKWVIGAGLSMYMENSVNIFNTLKENDFIKSLNLIDKDNDIKIDILYKHFAKVAKKSAVTFSAPFLGIITLKADDIDKIYSYIQGGCV